MALKDLLVYVDQSEQALVSLRLAADLAIRHGSRLTVLYVNELSEEQLAWRRSAELGLVSAEGMRKLDQTVAASVQGAINRLRSTLETLTDGHGLHADFQSVEGEAAIEVPQHARYADLCILGRDETESSGSVNYTFAEQLLFVTGRPVLFVPPVASLTTFGRHIAVAWNSSRPATRSLNDALPLIERAERTTILMVNPARLIGAHHASPGERIVEHLRRHDAVAEVVQMDDVPPNAVADALQSKAQAIGADLIVAGAFGHPRLWEKLLGGVTNDLMSRMRLPIFMSH
jgi:nucleotide-binding universal stress UspA family protein